MSTTPHIVLLGSGFVGRRVVDALAARATVSVLDLPTHPALAGRGPEGRDLLLEEIDRTGAAAVVNTCGLLRGSEVLACCGGRLEARLAVAWVVARKGGGDVGAHSLGGCGGLRDRGRCAAIARCGARGGALEVVE